MNTTRALPAVGLISYQQVQDHYGEMPIIVVVDCVQAEHGVILNISCFSGVLTLNLTLAYNLFEIGRKFWGQTICFLPSPQD